MHVQLLCPLRVIGHDRNRACISSRRDVDPRLSIKGLNPLKLADYADRPSSERYPLFTSKASNTRTDDCSLAVIGTDRISHRCLSLGLWPLTLSYTLIHHSSSIARLPMRSASVTPRRNSHSIAPENLHGELIELLSWRGMR